MNNLHDLSPDQLKRAAAIKEEIINLEDQLTVVLGTPAAVPKPVTHGKQKRKMNAAGRARIKAAQKARWAKIKKVQPATVIVPAAKKKFTMSAAAKAKIAAAAKARWARVKAGKKA